MRIFLNNPSDAAPEREGQLAVAATVPIPLPPELVAQLDGAPSIVPLAVAASKLAAALGIWSVELDIENLTRLSVVDDEIDELDVLLLPLVFTLGRDLALLERGDAIVGFQ